MQPKKDYRLYDPNPANYGFPYVVSLDEQIKQANQDGLAVLLMPWRTPLWENPNIEAANASASTNVNCATGDRCTRDDYNAYSADQLIALGKIKSLEWHFPTDQSVNGPWGLWIQDLWARYYRDGWRNGYVTGFEVVNEPNLQMWPQRSQPTSGDQFSPDGSNLCSYCPTAAMMQTMDTISGYYGKPRGPWLFAPSVSDFPFEAQYRLRTTAMFYPWGGTYSEFIPNLLGWLDNIGFRADDRWCWSYHTYDDI
jgi:hypothetical protein